MATEVVIEGRHGDTAVFLSEDGDHVVVRFLIDAAGFQREITLPSDSFAWDKAVQRAQIAEAFL